MQAEMKRLAAYSIVNSLTMLDGVNLVKLMVNNMLSYRDMGTELLLEEGSELDLDSPYGCFAKEPEHESITCPNRQIGFECTYCRT